MKVVESFIFEMPVVSAADERFVPSGPVVEGQFERPGASDASGVEERTSRRLLRLETGEQANKSKRWGVILSGDEIVGGVQAVGDEVVDLNSLAGAVGIVDREDVVMVDAEDAPPPIPTRSPSRLSFMMEGLSS
jgi:hypothetical protein